MKIGQASCLTKDTYPIDVVPACPPETDLSVIYIPILSFPLAGNPFLKKDSGRAGMTEKAKIFWTDPRRGEDKGQNDMGSKGYL